MTLQDLNCFITVAETLSYTQTAQRMYISQPAVTKHIASLEKEFEVSLIDRSNRRSISLTEAGRILYNALKTAQELFDNACRKLKSFSTAAPVIINLVKGISLPDELVRLYNDFAISILPSQVVMDYRDYTELTTALDNGELVICEQEALPSGTKYMKHKLTEEPVPHCLIASAEHPAFQNNPDPKPADFAGSPVYLCDSMSRSMYEKYITGLTKVYGKVPDEIYRLSSIDSVYLYLHAHRGITLNTRWIGIANSSAMRVLDLPITTDYYLCWNQEKILPSIIEKISKIVRQEPA